MITKSPFLLWSPPVYQKNTTGTSTALASSYLMLSLFSGTSGWKYHLFLK